MASFNDTMIENFRANNGILGGPFEGKSTLLLHTPGRKSGKEFVNPLVAAPYGDSYIICGSAGGALQDPQWVANLEADPHLTFQSMIISTKYLVSLPIQINLEWVPPSMTAKHKLLAMIRV